MASIEQKNKLSIMNAMMGNPQIAKTMHEAFKAPLGSTKRKKGQDIIAIFSKVDPRKDYTGQGGIFDGKGGPMIGPQPFIGPQQAPTQSPLVGPMPFIGPLKNPKTSILPKAPSLISTFASTGLKNLQNNLFPKPTLSDKLREGVSGFVKDVADDKESVLFSQIPQLSTAPQPGKKGESLSTIVPKVINEVTPALNVGLGAADKTLNLAGMTMGGLLKMAGGVAKEAWEGAKMVPAMVGSAYDRIMYGEDINPKPTLTYQKTGGNLAGMTKPDSKVENKTIDKKADGSSTETSTITTPAKVEGTDTKIPEVAEGAKNGTEQQGAVDPTTGKPFSTPTQTGAVSNVQSGGDSTSSTQTGGTTGGTQTGAKGTSTPVPGGKPNGADMETLQMAFAGTPVENMPVGKDYQKQRYDLRTLVETENNVNGLKKQAEDLQTQFPNVKIEYADYIRGKDQAISQIDKMLSEAYNVYSSGGLTPEASERQKQYINMLEGMKSNHNVSYTKFLNRSIDQINNEVSRVDNLYKNAVDKANTDYERRGSLLKADYETHLQEYVDAKKAIEDANKANMASRKEFMDSLGLTIDGALKPIKSGEYVAERAKIAKDENLSQGKDKNEINPNIELSNFLVTKIEKERNYTQQTLEATASAMANRFNGSLKNDPEGVIKEISTKWIPQLKDIITGEIGQSYPVWKNNSKEMAALVLGQAAPQIKNYIEINFDTINKAMKSLNETPGWLWGSTPAKTKDQFITDNSSVLNPIILESIFDSYEQLTKDNKGVPVPITDLMNLSGVDEIVKNYTSKMLSEINVQ